MAIIGIDASRLDVAHPTGPERYAWHLTRALLATPSPHQFVVYLRSPLPERFWDGLSLVRRPQMILVRPRRFWTHWGLARALRTNPPDVLLVPAHVLPLRTTVPSVVVLHDAGAFTHPEAYTLFDRFYLRWAARYAFRRATTVVTVSAHAAETFRRVLPEFSHVPLVVIPPGALPLSAAAKEPAAIAAARRSYGLARAYMIVVGRVERRKNIETLLQAYDRLTRTLPLPPDLVFVGSAGTGASRLMAQAERLLSRAHIFFLGYVPDDARTALVAGATFLAFPSLVEGFGFALVEAFTLGIPAIVAAGTGAAETGGVAVLAVPPRDPAALAGAFQRLLTDPALSQRLRTAGLARASEFRWETAARQFLRSCEQTSPSVAAQ